MHRIRRLELLGLIFTLIFGTLWHFAYDWSGGNVLVGMFAPVNESVWEHLKLVFTPLLIYSVFEYISFGHDNRGFIPIKLLSVLLAMGLMIILFYTYSGIIGKNIMIADILIFVISVFAAFIYSEPRLVRGADYSRAEIICACVTAALLILCFVLFTFYPPHIGLFQDPISGGYGIFVK